MLVRGPSGCVGTAVTSRGRRSRADDEDEKSEDGHRARRAINNAFFTAGPNHESDGLFGTLTPLAAENDESVE